MDDSDARALVQYVRKTIRATHRQGYYSRVAVHKYLITLRLMHIWKLNCGKTIGTYMWEKVNMVR